MTFPGVYKHYKGAEYLVIGVGQNTETLEELVVYKALYHPYKIWVRPKQMFEQTIVQDGVEIPRFKFIHSDLDNIAWQKKTQ